MECLIKKTDDELQIVYGEVYAPNVPDVHGEFMTPVEVRKMAHKFLATGDRVRKVDTNHDNEANGSVIVESFIAGEDDLVYIPEAWVVGMHVPDSAVWAKIKSGDINGFSLEALVHLKKKIIEVEMPDVVQGVTAVKADDDPDTGHTHRFEVHFDEEGKFQGGQTSTDDGHFHLINKGTVTEPGPDGHTHRYSVAEQTTVISAEAA